jgi:hypothetical protein
MLFMNRRINVMPNGFRLSEETKKKMSEARMRRYHPVLSREEMVRLYLVENKSDVVIGKSLGVTTRVIQHLRNKYGIRATAAQLAERTRLERTGKKWPLEACRKMSESRMGNKNPNWGKPKSPETKAKLRAAHLGSNSHQWRGGRIVIRPGYIKIMAHDHPSADSYGYVFEHRLVAESVIGRYLGRREAVHHVNKKHDDNRPENLIVFKSHGAHLRFERNCALAPADIVFDGRLL